MIDNLEAREAFRDRLMTLVIATTGSIALAATTAGYTRAAATGTVSATAGAATFSVSQAGVIANGGTITVAGVVYTISAFNGTTGATLSGAPTFGASAFTVSFIGDGFAPGMEVIPLGMTVAGNNAVASGETYTGTVIIQSVTPTLMTITGGRAVEAAAAGKTITAGLPADRRWQDTKTPPLVNVATKPYIQEQWVRGSNTSIGYPEVISNLGHTGQYVVSWFGLGDKGANAMSRTLDAVLDLFPPGYSIFVGSDMLRIKPAPYADTPTPLANGYSVSNITIPWRAVSANMNITAA